MYRCHCFELICLFQPVSNYFLLSPILELLCIFINISLVGACVTLFLILGNARIIDKSLSVLGNLCTNPPKVPVFKGKILKLQLVIILQQVFCDE